MAALPKKRISRVRGRTRRAHIAIKLTKLSLCANCRHPKPGHIVCPECGFYGKKKILTTKTDQRIAKQLIKTKKDQVTETKKTLTKTKLKSKKDFKSTRSSKSYGELPQAKTTEIKAEAKDKNTRTTDEIKASKVKNK